MKIFGKKEIYLDNASSTKVDRRVLKTMKSYWNEKYGNAGEKHKFGREAKIVLEQARENVSKILNSNAREIVFTSGGTESNNLAILGFFNFIKNKTGTLNGYHAITSEIEHASVLETFKYLEKQDLEVSYIKINEDGIIDLSELKEKLKEKTVMISVMMVNNEIGTIQPIKEISEIIKKFRKTIKKSSFSVDVEFPIFHTDASQAPLFLDLNTKKLEIDMLTIDGQKIYGPKGIGVLFIKNGIKIQSQYFGGSQEFKLRAGTENIPLIVGMCKSLEIAQNERKILTEKITKLRDYFLKQIFKNFLGVKLNGSRTKRIPNNVNVSFEDMDHEFLSVQLDEKGIFCSTKSACLNDKNFDSYVLNALNRNNIKNGAIRFSLGKETTKTDLKYVLKILKHLIIK